MNNRESAVECIEENKILQKIIPDVFELNGIVYGIWLIRTIIARVARLQAAYRRW